jgi:hypothetical protein
MEKGQEKVVKTKRIWCTVSSGGFANGRSYKLAVGASQDIPAEKSGDWEQHLSDLTTDLKNQVRLHLSTGEAKPKLLDRMVQIIMPK